MKDLINISDTQVSINDHPLQVVEYKGERVVSSYDIASLHNKLVKRVNEQFERLFTERGYLKLVKSFTDDLSWQVQDLLVDSYFKLKEALTSKDALLLSIIKAEGEAATAEAIRRYEAEHVLPLEKYKKRGRAKGKFLQHSCSFFLYC